MISEIIGDMILPKETRVKITDSEDKNVIGVIGSIRHNFPGVIWGNNKYVLSISVEKEFRDIAGNIYNLVEEDKYTPIFVRYYEVKDCYYIEGINFILGQVLLDDFQSVMKKYNGEYDYNMKRYTFKDKQLCIGCLQYFEEAFVYS